MSIDYAGFANVARSKIDEGLWCDGGYTTSTLQGQFGTVYPQVRKATVALFDVLDLRPSTRTLPAGAAFAEAVDIAIAVGNAMKNVQSQLGYGIAPARDLAARMSVGRAITAVCPTARRSVRLGVRQPVMELTDAVRDLAWERLASTGSLFSA